MRLSALRAVTIVPLVALMLTACGGGTSGGQKLTGGKATFAEGPAATPNYILPLTSCKYFSVTNLSQFIELMYRPLYWFGENGQVKLNSSLSLASDPVYSDGGKTVTMKLKGWKWSDSTPITSRDVEFWMNLYKANLGGYCGYTPGYFPDNVTSMSYPDSTTVVFGLDKAYGSYWFNYNELSQITPLPQHVWDKISNSGTVCDPTAQGVCDRNPATAKKIYAYLDGQSKTLGTFATNPLWQVVSGPWKLKSFTTEGAVAMVPNPGYSGPVKPTIAEFDEQPYTTATAEFNVLHSGGIDLGYIPNESVSQKDSLKNYTFEPWIGWQFVYFQENFKNAVNGAIYKQLYFRQAMQHMVDQDTWIKQIFKGYAVPTYGPVPVQPASNFVSPGEKTNPYPYDPTAAAKLLSDNGWTVNAGGVSTCSKPGSGAGQCGAGIASGQKASFKLEYASGSIVVTQEMQALKTAFSKAGIELNLSENPFNTVIGDAFGGTTTADMDNWGGGWIYAPDYLPTGESLFSTGAGSNGGAYSDPTMDANITASTTSNDVSAIYTYEDYVAKQLPVIFIPSADAQLTMAKKTLHGWSPQDPLLQIYPENWYFTAS
jgi:peptide/nickel transport system substrate-binding protein